MGNFEFEVCQETVYFNPFTASRKPVGILPTYFLFIFILSNLLFHEISLMMMLDFSVTEILTLHVFCTIVP